MGVLKFKENVLISVTVIKVRDLLLTLLQVITMFAYNQLICFFAQIS